MKPIPMLSIIVAIIIALFTVDYLRAYLNNVAVVDQGYTSKKRALIEREDLYRIKERGLTIAVNGDEVTLRYPGFYQKDRCSPLYLDTDLSYDDEIKIVKIKESFKDSGESPALCSDLYQRADHYFKLKVARSGNYTVRFMPLNGEVVQKQFEIK